MLGVIPGEKVNVMVPQGQFTPAGTMPRMRQFTVAGVFNSGHYEFDSAMSFINLTDAEKLMRTQTPRHSTEALQHAGCTESRR